LGFEKLVTEGSLRFENRQSLLPATASGAVTSSFRRKPSITPRTSAPLYTLLFDTRTWTEIEPLPVRRFRGFSYDVPKPSGPPRSRAHWQRRSDGGPERGRGQLGPPVVKPARAHQSADLDHISWGDPEHISSGDLKDIFKRGLQHAL